jgi:hypothetical protein
MFAKQALYCLSRTSSPFSSGYFADGDLENYLPGLASIIAILLISASQVARITGVSHQHPPRMAPLLDKCNKSFYPPEGVIHLAKNDGNFLSPSYLDGSV